MRPLFCALCIAYAACAMPRKPTTPPSVTTTCESWAVKATLEIQMAPEPERYARALEAIGDACEALPSQLRGGAKTAARRLVRGERNDLLDAATRRILPQACHPWSPSSPALDVVKRCPLDPDLKLGKRTLEAMSGAEYNFLKAMQFTLRQANEYPAEVEALLIDFARAAALQGKPESGLLHALLALLHRGAQRAVGVALGDRVALVVDLLAAREPELNLGPAAVEVELERDEREARRLELALELVDLAPAQQEL